MEQMDVSIMYYPETSKGHDLGVISFRNDVSALIDSERVQLEVDGEGLTFKKSTEGLKLNNNKIQLWSLAWIGRKYRGEYPLKFDIQTGCYKILFCDRKDHKREPEIGSRLGTSVQYTSHKNEGVVGKEINTLVETPIETFEPSAPEKAVINILLDKLVGYLDAGKLDAAKSMVIAVKNLINE